MEPMLVMLLMIIFVPGVGELFSAMVIGNGVTIRVFLVRKVSALGHGEQRRVV